VSAERLAGHATVEGTRRASDSFAEGVRTLGRTGLVCAPLGFSARKLAPDRAEHRRALADALRGGVTLVDVGPAGGKGAELVAIVLAQLVQAGEVRRDGVIVVVELDVDGGQERAAIEAAHARLGLEHIDLALVAASSAVPTTTGADARERWRRAIAALEDEASAGRIGAYGVAGSGLAQPESDPTHVSLAELLAIARDVAGAEHRLSVARLPLNLLELGAAIHGHARAGGRTTLAVAAEADVGVIAVRPLAAELDGRRIALVTTDDDAVAEALAILRRLEGAWADDLGRRIVTEDGRDNAIDLFRWGQELAHALPRIDDASRWQALRHDVIAPQVGHASAALLATLSGEPRAEFAAWWMQYGSALHRAFDAIEARLGAQQHATSWPAALARALDPFLPERWRDLPWSRRALLAVLSAPIACACATMRDPAAVWDLLALREHPIRLLSAAAGPVDLAGVAAQVAQIAAEAP
jgi:aryl-alcohol dehydrogenase-like predicted oxidoreductase